MVPRPRRTRFARAGSEAPARFSPSTLAEAPIADDHDRRYRFLFSHPGFVERLLTSFVTEPFVGGLDFSTLERVNATFVSPEFARREADVIWKLSFRGRPVFLFLLIELQSSVDRWMALRFLRYLAEFYQSLATETRASPLPAVFPLLLYTGDPTWSAARSTGELIRPAIPDAFIPHLAYYPILVNEIPVETLRRVRNAVSAVFYVENADPRKLSETLDDLIAILSDEAPEQFEVFGRWMSSYLAGTSAETAVTEPIRSAREVRSMFATRMKEYGERLKEEGRLEGRREGQREGRREGRREVARAMKTRGIDATVIEEITGLSAEEIDVL